MPRDRPGRAQLLLLLLFQLQLQLISFFVDSSSRSERVCRQGYKHRAAALSSILALQPAPLWLSLLSEHRQKMNCIKSAGTRSCKTYTSVPEVLKVQRAEVHAFKAVQAMVQARVLLGQQQQEGGM